MRYIVKYRELSHCQPKAATGNHEADREVLEQALVRLSLYRVVHQEAPISHVRALLFDIDPTVAPFCPSAVVHAEQLLGLRMNTSSPTCEKAYWAINLHKRHAFWHSNYPEGRADVSTRDIIDTDQAGMKIEESNPNFGKTVSWERCHFDGLYRAVLHCLCYRVVF